MARPGLPVLGKARDPGDPSDTSTPVIDNHPRPSQSEYARGAPARHVDSEHLAGAVLGELHLSLSTPLTVGTSRSRLSEENGPDARRLWGVRGTQPGDEPLPSVAPSRGGGDVREVPTFPRRA